MNHTMNIVLSDGLKAFVEAEVAKRGHGSASEYVLELIHKDQERARFRALLLDGAESDPVGEGDAAYFEALREHIRRSAAE